MKVRTVVAPLALAMAAGACGGAAALGSSVLSGVFTAAVAAADSTATVDAEIRANDREQQLLQVVTDEGRRGVVRWDVQTKVVHGTETYGAVALAPGDRVQMRLRKTSDVDIYTDYVLVKQRARVPAADTTAILLEGTVSELDAARGQLQVRTAAGTTVLVTLPYNPPAGLVDRFGQLGNGQQVRLEGRYISEHRFELARFR
jgi:hypothetical protein